MPKIFTRLTILIAVLALIGCAGSAKKATVKAVAPTPVLEKPTLLPEQHNAYKEALSELADKNYILAKESFTRLIEKQPRLAGAYVNLGIIYEALEQIPDALKAYDTALKINPNNIEALIQSSLLHIKRGRFSIAEERLLKAERIEATNALVQFNLGVLYELYLQDYDEAIEHYEKYVEHSNESDVDTVRRWIKLLERK